MVSARLDLVRHADTARSAHRVIASSEVARRWDDHTSDGHARLDEKRADIAVAARRLHLLGVARARVRAAVRSAVRVWRRAHADPLGAASAAEAGVGELRVGGGKGGCQALARGCVWLGGAGLGYRYTLFWLGPQGRAGHVAPCTAR